jgi:hypothetical protein
MPTRQFAALCIAFFCVFILAIAFLANSSNRNRFVQVEGHSYAFDTRSGQYCDPSPRDEIGFRPADAPLGLQKCSDLAKSWR